jgi:signal transduction histidine kinase/CheY-like chemotaxis protein
VSTVPLRRRLFVLVAAAILPVAAISGLALYVFTEKQREQAGQAGLEISRALSIAVDADLDRAVAVLQVLAAAPALDTGDVRRFHGVMQRVLAANPDFVTMVLADPSGKPLANARTAFGAQPTTLIEPESFERAVRSRAPTVGYLSRGPGGVFGIPVRVPVMRDGELRYVLTAAMKPDSILDVVNRQRVPPDWVVSVFDGRNMRVARSRQHVENLGTLPAPSLLAMMEKPADEAYGFTHALEGDRIYTAFSRSSETRWTVAIGVPASLIDYGAWRSIAAYGTGLLLSIALGVLAALAVGRRITRPMEQLSSAARALGRREPLAPPVTPILEIRQVADSLEVAADERARSEAEREALLEREKEARAAAEAANRAKDEFLALLGHELRNPLGAIMNAARLLEHPGIGADDAARARGIIGRQAEHLAHLTDDLLDAGRAIMGKIVLELRGIDLAAAAGQTIATLRSSGRLGQHRVVEDLQPAWLQADATRLEQIIGNLVVNAVKYTPVGGTITVSVRKEGGDAMLRVADNGIGMRRELLTRVFEPFVQGEPGLDRSAGGLGLGLTLVRQLAGLHGGSATAESDGPGRGSAFTVRFPAIEPRPSARRAAQAGPVVPGRDILLVEDNADARETLRRLLELQGHRVRVASEGSAALETLRAAPPEVALIDIGLPGMDGYEIARRVRADGSRGKRIFLIALTGYGLTEDRRRTAEAGFDLHLVKPVDYEKLNEALRTTPAVRPSL